MGDLGVRIAADESAHTAEDVAKRIAMGYGAIALKVAAKTLTMTLKMLKVAHEQGVPCFLADLTCTPILVDWNKTVAARLAPFPGLKGLGLVESNGHQNYVNWKDLVSYHPCPGASWLKTKGGVFPLDETFYGQSGGILKSSDHYLGLFSLKTLTLRGNLQPATQKKRFSPPKIVENHCVLLGVAPATHKISFP